MATVIYFPAHVWRPSIAAAHAELANAREAFRPVFFHCAQDDPRRVAADDRVRASHDMLQLVRDLYMYGRGL